jgi:aspartate racemase
VLLSANTAHVVFAAVEKSLRVPLVHIADAVAVSIRGASHKRVGLIGTQPVMTGDFYGKRLREKHGIETMIPPAPAREQLHSIILNELTAGVFKPEAKSFVLEAVSNLRDQGADGVVVGCTELPLLIRQADTAVTLYDTARLHVEAALELVGITQSNPRAGAS